MHTLDIAPLRSESPPQKRSGLARGISQFYLHTHTFIRNRSEPYLPLPSQLQLVLIYRPRRDGRLSRPWCKVAQAEIRTRNLPIANPALYHTATSAPKVKVCCNPYMIHPYQCRSFYTLPHYQKVLDFHVVHTVDFCRFNTMFSLCAVEYTSVGKPTQNGVTIFPLQGS